jgi:predicted adenine nucleotide alpha hydrolase (AANH) superfamily ATPase
MNTVDMEAINSEESEDDVVQYPIYDWKKDTVNKRNIAISRKSDSEIHDILKTNSEKIKKTQSRYPAKM